MDLRSPQATPGAGTPLPLMSDVAGRWFCPVELPWFRFRRSDLRMNRLRRRIYLLHSTANPVRHSTLRRARYAVSWPVAAALRAAAATRLWGATTAQTFGVSPARQFCTQLRFATGRNLGYRSFYCYRLWSGPDADWPDEWLQAFEFWWLQKLVYRGVDIDQLDDKERFLAFCGSHALPTIPIVLTLDASGRETWHGDERSLPAADLVTKSRNLGWGAGVGLWSWQAGRGTWRNGETEYDTGALLQRLRVQSRRMSLVVQRRVRNHAAAVPFTNALGALCTLRAVTLQLPGEPARHFRSVWRMPGPGRITDHFEGGLSAPVDEDGFLGLAARGDFGPPLAVRDDTGQRLEGSRLEFFPELRDLAVRAHQASGLHGFLGWDVAIVPEGPVLVECNTEFGVETLQAAFQEPLGRTEFVAAAERLLDTVVAAQRSR